MSIHHYCTLFNKNYLGRGLLAYQSLLAQDPKMYLWVLALDSYTEDFLKRLALPQMQVVGLQDVETPELLLVKGERTVAEYCWTLTPHWMAWVLEQSEVAACTYVDADLYFFNSPSILWEDFWESSQSVFITPHFYTPTVDYSETCGIYCVQFLSVKNTATGWAVLREWQNNCLAWCFNRFEPGLFGDQKYLDRWPADHPGVIYICQHRGCVAPWNVQQYSDVGKLPIVFYHFHALKWYEDYVDLSDFKLTSAVKALIYQPYVSAFLILERKLKTHCELSYLPDRQQNTPGMIAVLKRVLRGCYHIQRAPIGALCKT